MFNSIWNALSDSVWPFTVAVFIFGHFASSVVSLFLYLFELLPIVITTCTPWSSSDIHATVPNSDNI